MYPSCADDDDDDDDNDDDDDDGRSPAWQRFRYQQVQTPEWCTLAAGKEFWC